MVRKVLAARLAVLPPQLPATNPRHQVHLVEAAEAADHLPPVLLRLAQTVRYTEAVEAVAVRQSMVIIRVLVAMVRTALLLL
jgi:hypothetical protein